MAKVLITSEFFGKFDSTAKKNLCDAGHIVIDNPYGNKFCLLRDYTIFRDADALYLRLRKNNQE